MRRHFKVCAASANPISSGSVLRTAAGHRPKNSCSPFVSRRVQTQLRVERTLAWQQSASHLRLRRRVRLEKQQSLTSQSVWLSEMYIYLHVCLLMFASSSCTLTLVSSLQTLERLGHEQHLLLAASGTGLRCGGRPGLRRLQSRRQIEMIHQPAGRPAELRFSTAPPSLLKRLKLDSSSSPRLLGNLPHTTIKRHPAPRVAALQELKVK